MTYPHSPQPVPRPGPPPGGSGPDSGTPRPAGQPAAWPAEPDHEVAREETEMPAIVDGTGHPAVDAVLRSLANAAQLAPPDQIAEYEAAHRVLQETLASIDG